MDPSVWGAIITVAGATITYGLTKRHEFNMQWRKEKMNQYRVLLSSLSVLAAVDAEDSEKKEANKNFLLAYNTIALVAHQEVMSALTKFLEHIMSPQWNQYTEELLFNDFLLAVRKDIGLTHKDFKKDFHFRLLSKAPQSGSRL